MNIFVTSENSQCLDCWGAKKQYTVKIPLLTGIVYDMHRNIEGLIRILVGKVITVGTKQTGPS